MNTIKHKVIGEIGEDDFLTIQHPNRPLYVARINGRSFQTLVQKAKSILSPYLSKSEMLEVQDDIMSFWCQAITHRYG